MRKSRRSYANRWTGPDRGSSSRSARPIVPSAPRCALLRQNSMLVAERTVARSTLLPSSRCVRRRTARGPAWGRPVSQPRDRPVYQSSGRPARTGPRRPPQSAEIVRNNEDRCRTDGSYCPDHNLPRSLDYSRSASSQAARTQLTEQYRALSWQAAGSEGDDAPEVAAFAHVVEAGVDLVEGVGAGAQFRQLQLAAAVQFQHPRDVGARI